MPHPSRPVFELLPSLSESESFEDMVHSKDAGEHAWRNSPLTKGCSSGGTGIRTPDPLHAMQVLYQLSYTPKGPTILTLGGTANFSTTKVSLHRDSWVVTETVNGHSRDRTRCRTGPPYVPGGVDR